MLNVYPVLLSGGSGTRLWPVSRELYPKQLVNFIGKDSLIQTTIKRIINILDTKNLRIVCGVEHAYEIAKHVQEISLDPKDKIINEPCGRNTAPAILLAVLDILKKEQDAVLCIFPSDHIIKDTKQFHEKLISAIKLAENDYIVTFGIEPNYPETGYGYIEGGEKIDEGARIIKKFVEKPDKEKALTYIETGNFFWNSGMFVFKISVFLKEIEIYAKELLDNMKIIMSKNNPIQKKDYELLPNIAIDIAVMEKTKKGVVLPSNLGWSDIGSWKSLYDFLPKDFNGNVLEGDILINNTKNSFILSRKRLIAANNLDNVVIVETHDAVFVSDLDSSRDVKNIVLKLKENKRMEVL